MAASASKSALLLSPCLRWAGEGAAKYEDEFADTTKRDKGTNFHEMMDWYYSEDAYESPPAANWNDVGEWFAKATAWSKAVLEPRCETIMSEVYVATNFDTGEVHTDESVRNRAYPDKPGFLPGTADLVCILADGSLLVADWKTGGGVGADSQLLSLAVGLRRAFPLPGGAPRKVLLAILYAGNGSFDPSGVTSVEWEATESDLLSHQHAMAIQLDDVGERNDPVVGIHCTQLYCPHLAYCPGILDISEEASEGPNGLLPASQLTRKLRMKVPETDDEAGYTMARVSAAKRQLDYLQNQVQAYLANGGKAVIDGWEYSKGRDGHRWRKK